MNKVSIDIIVPTYQEFDNIPLLIERLKDLKRESLPNIFVTFVDDNSNDGSQEFVSSLNYSWVTMIVRPHDRGLSTAVIDGINSTFHDYIVAMDADLSHPPCAIPHLLDEVENGSDFTIGSRYVTGGSTDDDWGVFRWLNSIVATLLAKPLTRVKDPMSGFFILRRSTYEKAQQLNPIGYKVGLELLVKCNCTKVTEVPIHFSDRLYGESKLSFKEQLKYLQHLRRLYIYKYSAFSEIIQFAAVGVSGMFVNLVILTLFIYLGLGTGLSVGLAILVSMVTNFLLNRRFTFSHSRGESIIKQFSGFAGASGVGAMVNYTITMVILHFIPGVAAQIAAIFGIATASIINFTINKFMVFKKKHYIKKGSV